MPCGCFINCKQAPRRGPSGKQFTGKEECKTRQIHSEGDKLTDSFLAVKKRRFEFNLSFQQGYGVYKLSHATLSPALEIPACRTYFNCDFSHPRLDVLETGGLSNLGPDFDLSTPCPADSSSHANLLLEAGLSKALAEHPPVPRENHEEDADFRCLASLASHQDNDLGDTSSVFEGAERRLSHEVCRKIELTDWEWCRSKSERTPRQVCFSFPQSKGLVSVPILGNFANAGI